jgi:hypothetical protein
MQLTTTRLSGAQSFIVGRLIFLTAGFLLSSTSLFVAGLNGWNRGASLPEQIIWAGAGAALALLSLVGISGALTNTGLRRLLAALAYLLSLSFTIISALGSQHGGRILNEATSTALVGTSKLEEAYKRAEATLAKVPQTRPASVIQADIDAEIAKDQRLNDCDGWVDNSRLRATCVNKINPLRKELANAIARERLEKELASTSEALSSLTIAKPANADAASIGRYLAALRFNVPQDRLADLINLLVVTSVELLGGVALALGNVSAERSTKNEPKIRPSVSLRGQPNVSQNLHTDLSPKRQPKSQQNEATQSDVSDDKIAERSDNSAPNGQAKIFTKDEALAALLTDIGLGRTFASQSELAKRFGRSNSTISEWLREWSDERLISKPRKRGRCKAVGSTAERTE